MTYRIEISREALQALANVDKPIRRRIQTAIDRLQDEPRPSGAIALRGLRGAYRIRVGDDRVVYTISDARLLVLTIARPSEGRGAAFEGGGEDDGGAGGDLGGLADAAQEVLERGG